MFNQIAIIAALEREENVTQTLQRECKANRLHSVSSFVRPLLVSSSVSPGGNPPVLLQLPQGAAWRGPPTAHLPWGSNQPHRRLFLTPNDPDPAVQQAPAPPGRGSRAPGGGATSVCCAGRRPHAVSKPPLHSVAQCGESREHWTPSPHSYARDTSSHHLCPAHDSASRASLPPAHYEGWRRGHPTEISPGRGSARPLGYTNTGPGLAPGA